MKLGYLVSQYPAFSHTFILREVRQLREKGFEIQVASINAPDRLLDKLTNTEKEEADSTYYVKKQGVIGSFVATLKTLFTYPVGFIQGIWLALRLGGLEPKRLLYHLFYLVEAFLVGQWLKENGLSHLHVHFATPAASVGLLVKQIFPVSYSITVHGPDEFYDVTEYRLTEKICHADFVCCISAYARSQLMKLSPQEHWHKFEISRLGVDTEKYSARSVTERGGPGRLLCVGRLVPAKGQHILINATALLKERGYALNICFIGQGPDRESLEHHAEKLGLKDEIEFAGAVDQDSIRDYYRDSDVFVLPSFAEGLPVVLMEAMAMEIPCITTTITGVPELIEHNNNGLLTPASDDEALAQAIARLMDDSDLRLQLGKAGRRKVTKDYNLPQSVENLAGVFRRRLNLAQ